MKFNFKLSILAGLLLAGSGTSAMAQTGAPSAFQQHGTVQYGQFVNTHSLQELQEKSKIAAPSLLQRTLSQEIVFEEKTNYEQSHAMGGRLLSSDPDARGEIVVVRNDDGSFLIAIVQNKKETIISGAASGQQRMVTLPVQDISEQDHVIPETPASAYVIEEMGKAAQYQADTDRDGNTVIDVLAGFSAAAAKDIGDYQAFALAKITMINVALHNSKIEKTRMRLVGTDITPNDHAITTGTLSQIPKLFAAGAKKYSPDLIAGFFKGNNQDTAVGWAYVNGRYSVNASYSVAASRHEIGHNIGGSHCPTGDSHKYGYDNGHTRTIMCGNSSSYYSNPDLLDDRGLPLGDRKEADMARVWRTNASKISAYSAAVVPFDGETQHHFLNQRIDLDGGGKMHYIALNVPSDAQRLILSADYGAQQSTGKLAFYLSKGKKPTKQDYDYRSVNDWTALLSLTRPAAGAWYLGITDGDGAAVRDVVIDGYTYVDADAGQPPVLSPVANAGSDIRATGTGNFSFAYKLDGSKSSNGAIYHWQKLSGPAQLRNVDQAVAEAVVPKNTSGTTVYQLSVTNAAGVTHTDTMQLIVSAPAVHITGEATAVAGQQNTLKANANFTGVPDRPVTYSWRVSDQSGKVPLSGVNQTLQTASLAAGTYQVDVEAHTVYGERRAAARQSLAIKKADDGACQGLPAWQAKSYADGNQVQLNGRAYTARWWAEPHHKPGAAGWLGEPWADNGPCK